MKLIADIKKGIKYIIRHNRKVFISTATMAPQNILQDKVAIITGGSSGIGLSIAKTFSNQGAKVIITGRDKDKLKKATESIPNSESYIFDINNLEEQKKMIKKVIEKYGSINILVNNAGISKHEKDFLTVTEKDFDDQFSTNLKSSYFLTQNVINSLNEKQCKDLNILFISSERGSQCDFLPYGLTKAAIDSLVKGLSCRFIKDEIRVNGIAPGVTASNLVKIDTNGNMAANEYTSGRYFLSEEVSETALFLVSDYAKCISGEIIHTNDGNHISTYFKKD